MVTIKDIAREVGVSDGTVSYVLNGKAKQARIRGETEKRVLDAAKALGYRRDDMARAVKTGTSNLIGFWGYSPYQEYGSLLLHGCVKAAEERGMFIHPIDEALRDQPEKVADTCVRQRLFGLICYDIKRDAIEHLNNCLRGKPVRMISVSNTYAPTEWSRVGSDDVGACHEAVAYLAELGHRNIGVVQLEDDNMFNVIRATGFREGARCLDLSIPDRHQVSVNMKKPFATVAELLKRSDAPTALCCVSDYVALGVIQTALEMGLKVPRDLSVIGYGNLAFSAYSKPAITTVREKHEEIGQRATRILLSKEERQTQIIQNELTIRESTGGPTR